jgi:N-acetylglutamate synthase-like GNAT family acetyltransferase
MLQLLRDSGLPIDGLVDHLKTALVARAGVTIVGCAAVEIYPDGALLRSVAVAPEARGHGVGERLIDAALALAHSYRAPAVYLLTTTAESYFPRFGFVQTTRNAVPAGVQQSMEFRSACPASAVVMRKALEERG